MERERIPSVGAAGEPRALDGWFRREFVERAVGCLQLREESERDRGSLFGLFAEVQAEASSAAGVAPSPQLELLLQLQFEGQALAYANAFPGASHYVVTRRGDRCVLARMILDWTRDPVLGVDLAVRPSARRLGLGLSLMRAWVAVCDRFGCRGMLHVMPANPARRLYQYLGFHTMDAAAFPIAMQRQPRVRRL